MDRSRSLLQVTLQGLLLVAIAASLTACQVAEDTDGTDTKSDPLSAITPLIAQAPRGERLFKKFNCDPTYLQDEGRSDAKDLCNIAVSATDLIFSLDTKMPKLPNAQVMLLPVTDVIVGAKRLAQDLAADVNAKVKNRVDIKAMTIVAEYPGSGTVYFVLVRANRFAALADVISSINIELQNVFLYETKGIPRNEKETGQREYDAYGLQLASVERIIASLEDKKASITDPQKQAAFTTVITGLRQNQVEDSAARDTWKP